MDIITSIADLLKHFAWWQAAILIIIFGFVIILINQSKKFKLFDKKRGCGDCIKILYGKIIQAHMDYIDTKNDIIYQQIAYWEQISEDIIAQLLDNFIDKVKNTGEQLNDIDNIKEYKFFNAILCIAFNRIKMEIKKSFERDEFSNEFSKEFKEYCDGKVSVLTAKFREYLDSAYNPEDSINISEQFSKLLNEKISDIYNAAISIKQDSNKKLDNIEKDLNTCLSKETGINIVINLH